MNVSLPLPVDRILTQYAEALGRSKAQIVVDALCFATRHWTLQLRALRSGVMAPGAVDLGDGEIDQAVESFEKLTRQQRRALEREAAKTSRERDTKTSV
ncbi:MAG: hypothetical protein Q8K18_19565 [Burkholderiales bacterium]|nr:hypothetical protein [Burkholderiales bacterium]